MNIPRSDEESKKFFESILPADGRIKVRPMFGNIAAFVKGNMFAGLYGKDIFVRLYGEDQATLLENKGASMFEPMNGRPMKDYVTIPRTWRNQPDNVRSWVAKSYALTSKLPEKKKR
jgi:TfoX/Sxy family transcriptional regulator of competence genes